MRYVPWLLVSLLVVSSVAAEEPRRDYPIQPVNFTKVQVTDTFWQPRIQTNSRTTVWYDFGRCEETGRIDNFAKAGGLMPGDFRGIFYDDSDVYKVIEGAAYTLALAPNPELDQYLDALIAKIAAAQEEDGYLYTARRLGAINEGTGPERWSRLASSHELYNVGHLYEAAVAHFQATGKRNLLDVALKNAELITRLFGPGPGQLVAVPGHQEIEIGLVKLYRLTGEQKYLDTAQFFIDMRGRGDLRALYGEYAQDHVPVVRQHEAVGHAVRAGYLYAGIADVAALTGREEYVQALDRIWEDVVSRKLHITGGIGAERGGEAFGRAYELPNKEAYLETCAAIANALWNQRMFLLHGDAKYIDILERTIYNGFLSGVALSGDRFFYPNPLASDGRTPFNHGAAERSPWFGTACCPVNVVRFIPSLTGYIYAQRSNAAYVNLFVAGRGELQLDSTSVVIEQQTNYPWDGNIVIQVRPQQPAEFAVHVRIPGWVQNRPVPSDLYQYAERETEPYSLAVNGEARMSDLQKGYAVIQRTWKDGDRIEINFPMPVHRVLAHENVVHNQGRVAIERGPIVYCVEGVDHGEQALNLVLPDDAELQPQHRSDLLGGVTVIRGTGRAATRDAEGNIQEHEISLTCVPYAVWCHRDVGPMAVWLARDARHAEVPPPPTLASRSEPSASHCWVNDTPGAIHDQVLPQSSTDHSVPRFTWWDHRGSTEWVQYDLPVPAKLTEVRVYWFDDTGRGACRVPQSWRVLVRHDGEWTPVDAIDEYGVEKDLFNRVRFAPVTADAIRLEVQLQPEFSGGILEWELVVEGEREEEEVEEEEKERAQN